MPPHNSRFPPALSVPVALPPLIDNLPPSSSPCVNLVIIASPLSSAPMVNVSKLYVNVDSAFIPSVPVAMTTLLFAPFAPFVIKSDTSTLIEPSADKSNPVPAATHMVPPASGNVTVLSAVGSVTAIIV